MVKKILVTGISGFVGGHFVDYLIDTKADVYIYGTIRERSNLKYLSKYNNKIDLHHCEITDSSSVRETLKEIKPDYLIHLAGQSSITHSWSQPHSLLNANIISTINIFEGIKDLDFRDTRVLIIGSSDCYGIIDQTNIKIPESYPLKPVSLYAITKAVNEYYAYHYSMVYGLNIILVRTFNHTGPRRPGEYALSGFAKQIVEIEKGLKEPTLHVGNLNIVRDFLDVRDVVVAYHLALEKCRSGDVYNICSGKGYKLKDLLDILLSLARLKVKIHVEDKLIRRFDLPYIVGDNSKFAGETGWETKYDIRDTLKDLLDYWRAEPTL
jgi:GDP-4-dehydro-6-deoxy-D-mannose reductase